MRVVLPGLPIKDSKGNIAYYRGRIIFASERIQWVKSDHPEHKLVFLIGRTYTYWCPKCPRTVWQEQVTQRGRRTCPFCETKVLALSPGDWVRLHYRYHQFAESGDWWAARVVD